MNSASTSPPAPMNGYTKLASLMGHHSELAIFRRFGTLNARNLLYLQAELVHLELKLNRCAAADLASHDPDRAIYDRDWQTLSESGQLPDGNPEQWDTILGIRKTLKEYNEALVLQSLVSKHDSPNPQDLKFLQNWMKRPTMGYVYLLGADSDIWEKPDPADLIAIQCRESQSFFSHFLGDFVIHWYHRCLGKRFRKPGAGGIYANTVHYSQDSLLRLSTLVGTTCASILPVLATVVLYFVGSMRHRLAIVGVFTAAFSAALGIFTNGRVVEIFSATAAFSAVLVVFVGTTSGTASGSGAVS